MKIFLCLLLLVSFQKSYSQKDTYKIDSVFQFCFFVFEMETTNCCPHEKYPDYYYSVISKTNDTLYLNKYVTEASEFIQKLSNIKSPTRNYEGPGPVIFTVTSEMVGKWKNWYAENRSRLRWSKKKNRPVLW